MRNKIGENYIKMSNVIYVLKKGKYIPASESLSEYSLPPSSSSKDSSFSSSAETPGGGNPEGFKVG